jgi:glutathione S-transferase
MTKYSVATHRPDNYAPPAESRLALVARQLARSPYLAGANFTAAEISVTYALLLARRAGGVTLGDRSPGFEDVKWGLRAAVFAQVGRIAA